MEVVGVLLLLLSAVFLLCGLAFSILPGVPGPPFSALCPPLMLLGLVPLGFSVSTTLWVVVALFAALGVLVTIADLLAPLAGKLLGGTSRGAAIGSYYGLGLAMLFSIHLGGVSGAGSLFTLGLSFILGGLISLALLILGPLLGGFVGELASAPVQGDAALVHRGMGPMVKRAARSGIAQFCGLLLTTTAKFAYGTAAALVCAASAGWVLYQGLT